MPTYSLSRWSGHRQTTTVVKECRKLALQREQVEDCAEFGSDNQFNNCPAIVR